MKEIECDDLNLLVMNLILKGSQDVSKLDDIQAVPIREAIKKYIREAKTISWDIV